MSELRNVTIELHKRCCPLCNKWSTSEYSGPCGFEEKLSDAEWDENRMNRYFEELVRTAILVTQETDVKMEDVLDALSVMAQGKEVENWLKMLLMSYGFNEHGGKD